MHVDVHLWILGVHLWNVAENIKQHRCTPECQSNDTVKRMCFEVHL